VYEQYRDQDAFQAHLSSRHGRTFNDALKSLVVGGASRVTFLDAL
jgi:quinol monooxygenase YgiN